MNIEYIIDSLLNNENYGEKKCEKNCEGITNIYTVYRDGIENHEFAIGRKDDKNFITMSYLKNPVSMYTLWFSDENMSITKMKIEIPGICEEEIYSTKLGTEEDVVSFIRTFLYWFGLYKIPTQISFRWKNGDECGMELLAFGKNGEFIFRDDIVASFNALSWALDMEMAESI